MSSEHVTSIKALGKDNFDTWKLQIRALLVKNGTWMYVSGEKKKPGTIAGDDASLAATEAWEDMDRKAHSDLVLAISPAKLKHIVGCETANAVWLKLHTVYEPTESARKTTLLKQLLLQKMAEGEDVQEHIRKFFDAVDELCEMEVEINKDLLTIMLLYSLPPSYESFQCAIETLDYIPEPESMKNRIIEVSESRKMKQRDSDESLEMASKVEKMSVLATTTRELVLKTEETRKEAVVNNNGREQPEEGRLPGRFDRIGNRGSPKEKFNMAMAGMKDEKLIGCPNIAEIPLEEALSGKEADDWKRAIQTEFEVLIKNQTWDLVDRSQKQNIIECRIALTNKYNAEGILKRRKAKVVANGYLKSSYKFDPEKNFELFRLLMAVTAENNLIVHHLDAADAFLDSDIEQNIFMEVPQMFEEMLPGIISREKLQKTEVGLSEAALKMLQQIQSGNKVCLMKKPLYGLEKAGQQWCNKLEQHLQRSIGINYANRDIYIMRLESKVLIILTCFDDILLISNDIVWMSHFKDTFTNSFHVKDLGRVKYFLGMEFHHGDGFLEISQTRFIKDILREFGMENSKPAATPLDLEMRWWRSEEWSVDSSDEETESYPLQELVGRLMNLALGTRPDIIYAVTNLSLANMSYGEEHWIAAKNILRYLRGTSNLGLKYQEGSGQLECFCTAPTSEVDRSYNGIVFLLANSAVAWRVEKQPFFEVGSVKPFWNEAVSMARRLVAYLSVRGLGMQGHVLMYLNNEDQIAYIKSICRGLTVKFTPPTGMMTDILNKNLALPEHQKCLTQLGMSHIDRKKKNVIDMQPKHCP